ncbi:coiled-coil domain-containing protein [Nocardiopsis alba]|uniref:coiled-coil domain-containing protein n=1 Tax=Nocardiopsis alba TaxID=53437 RepID=UPI0033E20455
MQSDDLNRVDDYVDFWAPDPTDATWRETLADGARALLSGPFPGRARVIALVTALLAATALPAPATAAPLPPREPESMGSLEERAEALTEEYNGELRDMEQVMEEAERAQSRADATNEAVEEVRAQVRALAVATYTSSGIDPSMSLFVDTEPDEVIDRAVVIDYLSSSNQDRIDQLDQALSRDQVARENAEERLAEAEADMDELEDRRMEVRRLIADHPEQPMRPPDNITPRTEQMRDVIIQEFGRGDDVGGVGCYREVGGWVVGEHPKGRACDFMVDANGRKPPPEQEQRGWDIAHWAQDNAEDLGIMYIIYRQQIWDIRRGDEGWRAMSDRGNNTENHFDHVHISMF